MAASTEEKLPTPTKLPHSGQMHQQGCEVCLALCPGGAPRPHTPSIPAELRTVTKGSGLRATDEMPSWGTLHTLRTAQHAHTGRWWCQALQCKGHSDTHRVCAAQLGGPEDTGHAAGREMGGGCAPVGQKPPVLGAAAAVRGGELATHGVVPTSPQSPMNRPRGWPLTMDPRGPSSPLWGGRNGNFGAQELPEQRACLPATPLGHPEGYPGREHNQEPSSYRETSHSPN